MYSKRFRNKVKEIGDKLIPDWMVYACWSACIKRVAIADRNDLMVKHIGE